MLWDQPFDQHPTFKDSNSGQLLFELAQDDGSFLQLIIDWYEQVLRLWKYLSGYINSKKLDLVSVLPGTSLLPICGKSQIS